MNGIIYKIIFPNGKLYIGQTTQLLSKRIQQHISDSLLRCKKSKICNAIRKYFKTKELAKNSMIVEVIKSNIKSIEVLNTEEKLYIKKLDTFYHGYNSTLGGDGAIGYRHSDAAKKKISNASILNATIVREKNSKTNKNDVIEIRKLFLFGMSIVDINKKFTYLAYTTLNGIINNYCWKDERYFEKLTEFKEKNKINFNKAQEIREKYVSGKYLIVDLAIEYGTCNSNIEQILNNKTFVDRKYKVKNKNKIAKRNIKIGQFSVSKVKE